MAKPSRRERKERIARSIAARSRTRIHRTVKAGRASKPRKELTEEQRRNAELFFSSLGNAIGAAFHAFMDSLADSGRQMREIDEQNKPVDWPEELPDEEWRTRVDAAFTSGDITYSEWLRVIQERERGQGSDRESSKLPTGL